MVHLVVSSSFSGCSEVIIVHRSSSCFMLLLLLLQLLIIITLVCFVCSTIAMLELILGVFRIGTIRVVVEQ